jgi:hypothetical protein
MLEFKARRFASVCLAGRGALPHLWCHADTDAGVVQRPQVRSSTRQQRVAPVATQAQQVGVGVGWGGSAHGPQSIHSGRTLCL